MKRIAGAGGRWLLVWRGDEVDEKVQAATERAIDNVTERCVNAAKSSHPWTSRTGNLEGSIQKKPAKTSARKISGRWGAYGGRKVRYAFYLEMGTSKMGARPFLRPAADANYKELPGEIRKEL